MSSIIDRAFTQAYNEAAELYDKNELDQCIEKARELLDDGATPRYHRMLTWILLGNVLGNWDEANECFVRAESMWHIVRRWHAVGENDEVDKAMEDIRVALDELKVALAEEEPPEHDVEAAVADHIDAHDAAVEEETAINEDEAAVEEAAASSEHDAPEPPKADEGAPPVPMIKTPSDETPGTDQSGVQHPRLPYLPLSRRGGRGDNSRTEEILRKPSWRPGPTS